MIKKEAETLFDIRSLKRRKERGEITEEDYNKYLETVEESTEFQVINEKELMKEIGITLAVDSGEEVEEAEDE